jgi:glycosyltransferase involved in cell wall biosynthesis
MVSPSDARSGIALYTKILLRGLREIDVPVRQITSPEKRIDDCDVLHFQLGASHHHSFAWRLFTALAGRTVKPRLVVTLHEPTLHEVAAGAGPHLLSFLRKRWYVEMSHHFGINFPVRFILRRADACIVLSEFLLNLLKSPKASLIPHPVVPELLWRQRSVERGYRIYAPGFLSPMKAGGVKHLLEALAEEDFPAHLTINGPGSHRSDRQAVDELRSFAEGCSARLELEQTGLAKDEEFLHQFEITNLVFIPRVYTNGEVSGPLCYALGAGTPVLIPRLGAFDEVRRDGYPPYYLPGQVSSIRQQLKAIRQDYTRIGELSLRARAYWLEQASPHVVAAQHLQIYCR